VAEIFKLFSSGEPAPTTHTYESANRILPIVRRYTEEAYQDTEALASKLINFQKNSAQYRAITQQYDAVVAKWVERIHRVGGLSKGLWLVDFDTGNGYLCWVYPEDRVEYFHSYDSGFKSRVKWSEEFRLTPPKAPIIRPRAPESQPQPPAPL
jgi:hypothetical protein